MQIFCDFDGTITNRDSIVFLTEEFGGGEAFRLEVLDDIKTGRMNIFEAIERELATVLQMSRPFGILTSSLQSGAVSR